jgi:outer membrane receptor protein involved in Fe transport
MTRTRSTPSTLVLAITALAASMAAQRALAQAAAAPPAGASAPADASGSGRTDRDEKDLAQAQQVVVTGNTRREGLLKKEAGYSITTADAEQIKDAAPTDTADLLKIVPGVYVETTGGEAGANIRVRGFPEAGDSPYATMQMNGSPIYAAPTLSFVEGSSLFRIDDTIDHVEVLRGGTSPIYGSGQPGVSVNFVQRKGTDAPEGDIRLTAGDKGTGGLRRLDGYYAGKLADKWYMTIGGFYQSSKGERDTQYPSDRGGQVSGNLTHKLDDGGELEIYGRSMNTSAAWYTDIPVTFSADGKHVSSYLGVNPHTFTYYDSETRFATIETSPNPGGQPGTTTLDFGKGRGPTLTNVGFVLDQKIGDWAFNNKAGYTTGDVPSDGLVNGAPPQTLSSYIAAKASANGATAGSGSYVSSGAAVDPGQMVMEVGAWQVRKKLQSFTEEAHVSREIARDDTLTLGAYFADYSATDSWDLGNTELITYETRPRLVDVVLNNGDKVSRNGLTSEGGFIDSSSWNGRNTALYVADEWRPLAGLRLDAGLRREHQSLTGTMAKTSTADLDGDPTTLYDNHGAYVSGGSTTFAESATRTSWTLGANVDFDKRYSMFLRANSGVHLPMFDDVRSNTGGCTNGASCAQVEKIQQFELGFNAVTSWYTAYLSLYTNTLRNSQSQVFSVNGASTTFPSSSRSTGLEFEATIRPLRNFDVTWSGDVARARYFDSGDVAGGGLDGLRVARMPGFESRLTPSYRIPTDYGSFRVFGTYSWIGHRYSDAQNTQYLPAYGTLDLGASASLANGMDLRLAVTNVTNTLGLTEGNPRATGSGLNASNVAMARPLFARAVQVSVGYSF